MSKKAKILLVALVLVVVIYISTVSYTVLGSDSDKPVTGQMDIFDPVMYEEDLAVPLQLSLDCLPDQVPVEPAYGAFDSKPFLWRCFNDTHFPYIRQSHRKRSWYRGCREGQNINACSELFDLFLLSDAESVLFIS